jgi:formyl-CoA transferase
VAAVRTLDEALADPILASAEVFEEVEHPVAGRVRLLRLPVEFSTGRAGVRRMPPGPGEHTDEILREAGYSAAEVARLRGSAVV